MLEELLAAGIELVVGHVSGLSLAISLLIGAHYLGYLKHVAVLARHVRVLAFVLAGLVLTGALDVGGAIAFVSSLLGMLAGLIF